MKTIEFKNNDKMPAFGLGTWKSKPGEVYQAVKKAIEMGYRHIDCAPIYENENEVGEAIKELLEKGVVSREELWITSKLWNTEHAKDDVIPALERSMKDLSVDYLDLFLVHWPVALKKGVFLARSSDDLVSLEDMPLTETWEAMEEAVGKGLVRHIGVSNFGRRNLGRLISNATIRPEVNQVECHPFLQQGELLHYCVQNQVHVTAYAPLGSSDRPEVLKGENEEKLLDNPVIGEIASSKSTTVAQVLIAWALERGLSVIPKSVNPDRIKENFQAQEVKLSDVEMDAISKLDRGLRYVSGQFWVFEDGPYSLDDVWA